MVGSSAPASEDQRGVGETQVGTVAEVVAVQSVPPQPGYARKRFASSAPPLSTQAIAKCRAPSRSRLNCR